VLTVHHQAKGQLPAGEYRVLSVDLHEEVRLKGYCQRWPANLVGSAAHGRAWPGEPAKPVFGRTASETVRMSQVPPPLVEVLD
jgi:hypothetical protein